MSFYSNLPTSEVSSSLYPTIFEIVSSQEIDALLPASVRYILTNYWIARHPNKITLAINNYFQEWFQVLLKGIVEWHHIKEYNSTFVDRFYGLQRFNCSNEVLVRKQAKNNNTKVWPPGLQFTKGQKRVVFIQKVIVPYLKDRLDELESKWVAQSTFQEQRNDKRNLIRRFVTHVYPVFKKSWYLLDLFTKLLFLAGRIGSVSFLEYLFKIEYTRAVLPLSGGDARPKSVSQANRPQRQNLYALVSRFQRILANVGNTSAYLGSQFFPAFIFMLRVYQWWTTQDLGAKLQRKLNDIDKDIPRTNNKTDGKGKSTGTDCPICHQRIQNACVLETGYAACYPCALDHLTNNEGKCPVTGKKLLGCTYDKELQKWKVVTGVRKLLI
ncbi:hypothetical protein ZYGR_0P02550 [Zygosaccharomyces rouxii]|uniref:Peroxisome assembly protein 12 n=2 Tax=Zygosaccharomyces rouxii TaxID=4956 RepID=C5E4J0_ZYGRC|nr:uncharacterized protein ZYRO0E06534g [Zygosaccharomyces rouxii]KAH9198192.1 Pex12 amino terminal region-domain-containing protein [Zygosaccharomyces rouxii]GAV49610.1 hypothetical protein ZYGR_0P02550 [Zygosaccharomyces rouxii]CAR30951.1 ZYRO0E06534p [Zygosaccharomyces rouxii]